MNTNYIVYQQWQERLERQPNCLEKLCSCNYFFRKKTHKTNEKYQLKESIPQNYIKICVLYLDETLVHCQYKPDNSYDFHLIVKFIVQSICDNQTWGRNFIQTLSEYYEVIMWTASLKEYADPIMNIIDG
ncbi:unnamed protein product (macronuclear) [Paramecium tetraurelia]|uniref:Mitochondrial import inner membrane translocase subunit TIM50 n=1 Tax=Paramecium tetraurelia TaxID=5888 RepID=A0D738_PARTE|nr:uncharacterized protein GSPATT00001896001 [Paramecium tetraurelia]CAK78855.1 unnamed protein product [Paramecium tetraurelia]|eukprot:XP_001446252.1 hypothetical protein (macronuclear) [Paramecium tetraurelia strain d4-2]